MILTSQKVISVEIFVLKIWFVKFLIMYEICISYALMCLLFKNIMCNYILLSN